MARRRRSPPKAFDNLKTYLEWYADTGKNIPCCGSATKEEIRANRQHFDCGLCEHRIEEDALWAVNVRALLIYRRLCGRTTADLGLAGRLFEALTTGWSTADVLDLVERLERIRSILDPPRKAPANR